MDWTSATSKTTSHLCCRCKGCLLREVGEWGQELFLNPKCFTDSKKWKHQCLGKEWKQRLAFSLMAFIGSRIQSDNKVKNVVLINQSLLQQLWKIQSVKPHGDRNSKVGFTLAVFIQVLHQNEEQQQLPQHSLVPCLPSLCPLYSKTKTPTF